MMKAIATVCYAALIFATTSKGADAGQFTCSFDVKCAGADRTDCSPVKETLLAQTAPHSFGSRLDSYNPADPLKYADLIGSGSLFTGEPMPRVLLKALLPLGLSSNDMSLLMWNTFEGQWETAEDASLQIAGPITFSTFERTWYMLSIKHDMTASFTKSNFSTIVETSYGRCRNIAALEDAD